jgi:lactate permease
VYQQVLDPVAHSLAWSSLVAAIPLLLLFVLLGVLRVTAWVASLISLAVAIVVAVVVYGMPVGQTLLAGTEGAAFGFFPILWIVINAIWVYQLTVETGHFDVLRRSFASVSDDQRIQAVLIAFSFGALLEALAGFGTPVAVTSVMLMALGFKPLKAAALALTANTAPVAFGAMATPILTLAKVTELPSDTLGAMVGRQTPILALFVPLVLVAIVDGRRGVRETWLPALVCGVFFGIAQFAASNFVSVPLADVVASLVSAAAVVVLVRVWRPGRTYKEPAVIAGGAADAPTPEFAHRVEHPDSRADVVKAYAPYAIIIVVFVICQIAAVKKLLDKATVKFQWPGLDVVSPKGKPVSLTEFTLNLLTTPGTQMLIAGIITMIVLKLSLPRAVKAYGTTLHQLRWAIVTVMAVLALAFVMNLSGQTITLGTWMAAAGGAFALLSPILGWLGTAVTGSDTSANSLFGALQVTAANQAGLSDVLMAATNSSGGVLGKMISPQNLAIAAAAVGMNGKEGDIFRRVVVWSVVFLVVLCALSALQASPVLSWMVPQ